MDLPILSQQRLLSANDLIRLYCQTERAWTEHTSEASELDVGTVYRSVALPRVWDANSVLDAHVPTGQSASDALAMAREHFKNAGLRCRRWVMNPSVEQSLHQPLIELLISTGHTIQRFELMRLEHAAIARNDSNENAIKLIPARASYRHSREISDLAANETWAEPTLADAKMMHIDDPRFDSWLAIENGVAIATAGVLTVGEIGRIDNVYVAPTHRKQGVGRRVLNRVLDVCARSLFKHVMLAVASDNEPAKRLYESIGFRKFADMQQYVDQSE